jgi:hypothetical protein
MTDLYPGTNDVDDVVPPTEITPGPWRAIEHYGTMNAHHTYWNIESLNGFFGEDGHGFCLTGFISPPNARILGASLALYEALKAMLVITVNPADGAEYEDGEVPALDQARAALALAEGREP